MRKGKWIAAAGLLVIAVLIGVRVWQVNKDLPSIPLKYYEQNEEVSLDTGTGDEMDMKMAGYTIEVQDTEVMTGDELCERYAIDKAKLAVPPDDYYCLVTASFYNHNQENDTSYGVGLYQILLMGINYYFLVDSDMFSVINPDMPGVSFALRGDTGMTLLLPYGIDKSFEIDAEDLKKKLPVLLITDYPTRKMIRL